MGKIFFEVPQGDFVENPENMISLEQLQKKGREEEEKGRQEDRDWNREKQREGGREEMTERELGRVNWQEKNKEKE